jgi:hypothetical protein
MKLKIVGKVITSKFVGTGPSSYEKRIYRAAVSQNLRNTALEKVNLLGSGPRLMKKEFTGPRSHRG